MGNLPNSYHNLYSTGTLSNSRHIFAYLCLIWAEQIFKISIFACGETPSDSSWDSRRLRVTPSDSRWLQVRLQVTPGEGAPTAPSRRLGPSARAERGRNLWGKSNEKILTVTREEHHLSFVILNAAMSKFRNIFIPIEGSCILKKDYLSKRYKLFSDIAFSVTNCLRYYKREFWRI